MKKYKLHIAKILPLIVSGCIGAIIILLFYPLQKEIDQYYWNKQNEVLIRQDVIERRLEIVNEFIEEFSRYEWCSIRVGVNNVANITEEDTFVCYQNSSSKLLGLGLKVKYYYGKEVNNEFDNFAVIIQKYEDGVRNGDVESDTGKRLSESASKIIILMQKNMLEKSDSFSDKTS